MTAESFIDLPRLLSATFLAGAEQHETLSSTNDWARELPADAALPYLILAAEQIAGRGRGANAWWTGRGSLAMSLVIDPAAYGIADRHVLLVSLASAVALVLKGLPGFTQQNVPVILLLLPPHFAVAFGLWRRAAPARSPA